MILGSSDSNVENGKSTAAQERELALKKLLTPLVLVGDATSDDLSLDKVQSVFNFNVGFFDKNCIYLFITVICLTV